MNDRQDAQYAMATVLVRFINDNRPAIKVSKIADKEAADVLAGYQKLSGTVGAGAISTEQNTKNTATAYKELLRLLPVVQGPLRSLATRDEDADLLARATFSRNQLRKLHPAEFRDVSQQLLDAADAHQRDLADYALTAEVLAELRGYQQAFAGTVGSTSTLVDQRGTAHDTTDDQLRDLMQQVYELDKPMDVFRLLNPTLYNGYKKARRVGGRRSGGSKGDAPQPAPGQ